MPVRYPSRDVEQAIRNVSLDFRGMCCTRQIWGFIDTKIAPKAMISDSCATRSGWKWDQKGELSSNSMFRSWDIRRDQQETKK